MGKTIRETIAVLRDDGITEMEINVERIILTKIKQPLCNNMQTDLKCTV